MIEIPELNKEFTIKKEEINYQCKVVDKKTYEGNESTTIRIQILGRSEGGKLHIEKEPKFIDVAPEWFDK